MKYRNEIVQGDVLEVLRTIEDNSVNLIVTSPPYWACRSYDVGGGTIWDGDKNCDHKWGEYIFNFGGAGNKKPTGFQQKSSSGTSGALSQTSWSDNSRGCFCQKCGAWKGNLGLEPHPKLFIDHIVQIMSECKRVIRDDGSIWLNIGDSYYTRSGRGYGEGKFRDREHQLDGGEGEYFEAYSKTRGKYKSNWLQRKQKLMIPARVAIACQDELGLVLRNEITWVKQVINWKTKQSAGSCMPMSVQDNLTSHSESVFFFVKNWKNYFFDLNEIRVPHKEVSLDRINYKWDGHREFGSSYEGMDINKMCHPNGKNPGDCIMFPIEPSRQKHYASFPSTLPEFAIRAACPEAVCKKCGKPRVKLYDKEYKGATESGYSDGYGQSSLKWDRPAKRTFIGYDKCCGAGWKKAVVLDPFVGSGTTAQVAMRLDRDFIGIDLSEPYCRISRKKVENKGTLFMNLEEV